jgi:hypothetical protein
MGIEILFWIRSTLVENNKPKQKPMTWMNEWMNEVSKKKQKKKKNLEEFQSCSHVLATSGVAHLPLFINCHMSLEFVCNLLWCELGIRKPENLQPTTILYRRRREEGGVAGPLAPPTPSFLVSRCLGMRVVAWVMMGIHIQGPRALHLLFSGVKTCPNFQFTGM